MTEDNHIHTYDKEGNITCCSLEEKINAKTSGILTNHKNNKQKEDEHDHSHDHDHDGELAWKIYLPIGISSILLFLGLAFDHLFDASFFVGWIKICWYILAYLPVGIPVIKEGFKALIRGEVFTEFFLMSLATIGAFAIGEYPEGVAVMLFYAVGELFQTAAVRSAKNNIKALLDIRPKIANLFRDGNYISVDPSDVQIGDTIQVRVGESIPLDGTLISMNAILNTAALTGESKPQNVQAGASLMAGSINLEGVIDLKVEKLFSDSSIARILELVQNATARKSKTELLIRRLAKIYTPIVVYLAIAICVLPYFFYSDYIFSEWLYRALIFLVISCPCALVISIPLGYFGGLGAASKNGLLFKGATYLDQLAKVNTVIMDKTGTITQGVFKIKDIILFDGVSESDFMELLMAIESKSTHPIAKAILGYSNSTILPVVSNIQEIAGKGLFGEVNGKMIVVGNKKMMEQFTINVPTETNSIVESIVMVGIDGVFAGYVTIADELKQDAHETIKGLRKAGIKYLSILSGDKDSITQKIANELGVDFAKGDLLPEGKLREVESMKLDKSRVIAFVGDGINDAPVLAASDVGIAMGGLGSDIAIETADVIIQTDQPSRITTGIRISKSTQKIIWQNIFLAFGVKIIVLVGGALGLATMWQAVFADVGVALLAILNAVRLQHMSWD